MIWGLLVFVRNYGIRELPTYAIAHFESIGF